MKKILSFVMALAMVTSLVATPKVALLNKSAKKARTELTLPAVQKQQPQVKHVAKKNIARKAVSRKAAMETTATFTFASLDDANKTVSGVTLAIAQGSGTSAPAWNDNSKHLRVYANNSITISGSGITKIELTFGKTKTSADYADLTANVGSLVSGGESTAVGDFKTDTWTGTADEVVFTLGASGQRAVEEIVVTVGGEVPPTPPTPPTPTGDVEIKGLQYADAYYYEGYWDFDIYADEETNYFPEVYFSTYEEATSETSIVGTYSAYYAGYWTSANDSIEADYEEPVGTLTVTCVEQGIYNFVGSFVGTDGKTYTWNAQNVEVWAYDVDNDYAEITLTDGGEPTPVGDTIPLTTIDGLEFGYYASYSEEGAYNYTLTVYNSQSEEYVPQASFDIYTEQLNVFPGIYSAEAGNLGLDYSAYFPTADSEGEYLSAATIEITDGEDGMIHVTGVFITEAGQAYSIDLTAAPYVYDADYPYEPEDPIVLNLTAVSMEEDAEYGSEGMIYAYLYMEDESYVSLTYRALSAIQHLQDGTYPIADLEEESSYLTGYDFYGWPAGSYYEDVNGNVYYFVSGTVTVESLDGATTITINATSAHGSSITVTYSGETPQPSGDHTIVIADYADVNFTTLDGAYTVASAQNGGSTAPAYNTTSLDLRLYAKNTLTLTSNNGAMTEIVFNISDKGLTRQADITVSAGSITSYDMDNAKVIWNGNATEVTFTVGDYATHGSDGASKAGQFDFTSIDIVNPATGLFDVNVNANVNKFMYNGNVMINVNGVIYNVLGAKVAR